MSKTPYKRYMGDKVIQIDETDPENCTVLVDGVQRRGNYKKTKWQGVGGVRWVTYTLKDEGWEE